MNRFIIIVFTCCLLAQSAIAQKKILKDWETDTILNVPESVLYSKADNILYVSLIGGNPNANKDGRGKIARLSPDGKILDSAWVTGLNSPKGLGRYGNFLYVADATEVVVIDIAQARILYKIPVDSAVFLNDITIGMAGTVYVSDSRKNTIHRIQKKKASLYIDNLNNVNGLLAADDVLYAVSAGSLYKIDENKNITRLATGMEKSTDGLVQIAPDEFIVSSWIGTIYYVQSNGSIHLLTDLRSAQTNTADIDYNPKTKTLYVPTFWKKKVMAYKVY